MRDMDKFYRLLKLSWMEGLKPRTQNVVASYGSRFDNFNKTTLIAHIKNGKFLKFADNAGPKTVQELKDHFKIKEQEFITGVGIMVNNKLYQLPRPYRHHHCIKLAYDEIKKQVVAESQGFITSEGRYVTREEGLAIAMKAKQLLPRHNHPTQLFSESVW